MAAREREPPGGVHRQPLFLTAYYWTWSPGESFERTPQYKELHAAMNRIYRADDERIGWAYMCSIFECVQPFYSIICVHVDEDVNRSVTPVLKQILRGHIICQESLKDEAGALAHWSGGSYRGTGTLSITEWP
jgi:hypothetical protein